MQSTAPLIARLRSTETLRPTETLPFLTPLGPTETLRPTENLSRQGNADNLHHCVSYSSDISTLPGTRYPLSASTRHWRTKS